MNPPLITSNQIQDLVNSIERHEGTEPAVDQMLQEIADDFVDNVTTFACSLAKHRGSGTVDVKDVSLYLDKTYGIKIPGFDNVNTRGLGKAKKPRILDPHRNRLNLVKKTQGKETKSTKERKTKPKKRKRNGPDEPES